MSLPVPLTVRVGDRHITREVQSLTIRKEAIGGVRSVSFTLARPLSDLTGMDPLAEVHVYDGRTAEPIAQGRLADTGRSADSSGERWDCVAFGPAQHASDIIAPLVYIDRSISDGWRHVDVTVQQISPSVSTKPGDNSAAAPQGILLAFSDGVPVVNLSRLVYRYDRAWESGQKLARIAASWDAGVTSASWLLEAIARTNASSGGGDAAISVAANTAGGSAAGVVGTNFTNGRNTVELRFIWNGGASTVTGDGAWGWFDSVIIETLRLYPDGTEVMTGYTGDTVSHAIVMDLLGRMLPEYDGANATIDTGGTTPITQLTYPDGVTAEQVLADLMVLEPGYRWYTTPDTTGGGYGFRWEPWPTSVRYEATLDDGGSFPLSAMDIYNRVMVRWIDETGLTRGIFRTMACPTLDDEGLTRQAIINLSNEAGTIAQAEIAGDAFLAEHNVPKNAGTLTVARPIRDVITGRMVQPWEIEPGELVRIRGVEAYPDAFNADSNDGQGVFRIHAVDYTSDGNAASLSLDSDPRETEDALVKLLKQRTRR